MNELTKLIMEKEEAINHIKDLLCESNTTKPSMVVFELEKEALRIAIEALEKQIPKKPIADCLCYGCGCELGMGEYCEECGQAIDWSEYD